MPLTTLRRLLLAALLAVVALLGTAGPAAAHAGLVTATPSDGAVLADEPRQVRMEFSEPVTLRLSSIRVIAPDGRRVDAGPPLAAGTTLTVPLAPGGPQGTYVIDWRVSAVDDGHTTAGAVVFSVGAPSRNAALGGAGEDRLTDAVQDLAVWLGLAGLASLVGCAAIRLCCLPVDAPPGAADLRWPLSAGWSALLAGTVLQLFAYGPATQGESLAHLADRSLLSATLASHQGQMLVARILLLALIAAVGAVVLRRGPVGTVSAALLTLLLALTWAQTSHAADGSLVPLALAVTTVHVAAMAVWAGGLLTLVALAARGVELPAIAGRFSRLALGAVALLAVTGGYQAVREVSGPAALTGTAYGRLLLAKACVLAVVLAAAALTRRRLAARASTPGRALLVELGGVTLILVLTVLLLATAPARPSGGTVGGPEATPAATVGR
ncbi:copper resistance CopC/CopD family protein [Kitasatospora viridis]|uniref:Copper transport protein n=1 Tax=Kitasatospora viridis TaxID=281105 RepID=A0A561UBX9_9ACTN|nr:copper resistance protein CopC [Kitasatospora viridis]TWF96872.1 copper transport protein [Kitasatospora viridis]